VIRAQLRVQTGEGRTRREPGCGACVPPSSSEFLERLIFFALSRSLECGDNILGGNVFIGCPNDEDVAEALRRDAELDADPTQAMTLRDLDSHIQQRRKS